MLSTPGTADADGKFFRNVGAEADPTIPYQRAIVSYKDGIETLIVESTAQNAEERVGWVVPLPGVPTDVAACKPGLLRTMHLLTGPEIRSDASGILLVGRLVAVSCLLASIIALAKYWSGTPEKPFRSVLNAVLLLLVFLVVSGILLPSLGTAGVSPGASGVTVIDSRQIGAYDVAVISGTNGESIRQWLTERGFHVSEQAEPVLSDYAKRGWCFAAAQIKTGGSSTITPHPLKFVFPTERAVYPMKLTGVNADPMQLDLFIIADKAGAHRSMRPVLVDRYQPDATNTNRRNQGVYRSDFVTDECATLYRANNTHNAGIGHPEVVAVMWPDCVLTHLRGELDPEDMTEDFYLEWEPCNPYRRTEYAHEAAAEVGQGVAFFSLGVVALSLTIMGCHSGKARSKRFLAYVVCGVLLVPAVGFSMTAIVPTVETGPKGTGWLGMQRYRNVNNFAFELSMKRWPETGGLEAVWPAALAEACDLFASDHFGRLDPIAMDVPGGYEIERVAGGWSLTLYDRFCTPTRLLIGEDRQPLRVPSDQPGEEAAIPESVP